MGGGTMFRGVARLAGAAAVAAVPSAAAHCHVRQQENLSALLNLPQKDGCYTDASHKELQPSVDLRFDEEGRNYCVVEKREEASDIATIRELVLSPPPTEEEVDEATRELQTILQLSIPVVDDEGSVGNYEDDIEVSSKPFQMRGGGTSVPPSQTSSHLQALAAESSAVMKAFHLLQTNPKVQDVVKSLACDPAVWNAVLSNEKVQELTQEDPQDLNVFCGDDENTSSECESDDMLEGGKWDDPLFSEQLYSLVLTTKDYYIYVKGKIFSIMDSMFGSLETKIVSKESKSTKDKTVASCIMLAVAVLLVVVMRRTMTRYPRH